MSLTGFEWDLFLSYAHADDLAPPGRAGWVTQFVNKLLIALQQRLGGKDPRIFFDNREAGGNTRIPELEAAARQSALFLAVGSPSYATRPFPELEVQAFVETATDLSRVFMIECLKLNEGERYPAPLRPHIPQVFWKVAGTGVAMSLSHEYDFAEVDLLIHSLAQKIRNKIVSMGVLPSARTEVAPKLELAPEAVRLDGGARPRRVVLLAQETDDVEAEADQLRCYFAQYENEIELLPGTPYPQGADAFREALEADLERAHLFVQLLGRSVGRKPRDFPDGYTHYQFEAARRRRLTVMQWRHPNLIVDEIADEAYKVLLLSETVVASGLEAFKRQIHDWTRKPEQRPRVTSTSTVFIDADRNDLGFATEIKAECRLRNLATVMPPTGGNSSKASRQDLADSLTDSDVLLFIYGDTSHEWIRTQLRFFNKVKQKRANEPRIMAICSGPPPEKPEIGIEFPNARVIHCPTGWNMEPIRELLSELAQ